MLNENEFEYRMHSIFVDLGDDDPPMDLIKTPEPINLPLVKPQPFLLLRASGIQWVDFIRDQIQSAGLIIDDELQLNNFEEIAKRLYLVDKNDLNSYLWLMLSRKYLGDNSDQAHLFILNQNHLYEYQNVDNTKRSIRKSVGLTKFLVKYKDQNIDTDLHHIHAPDFDKDFERIQYEFSLLMYYYARRDY